MFLSPWQGFQHLCPCFHASTVKESLCAFPFARVASTLHLTPL